MYYDCREYEILTTPLKQLQCIVPNRILLEEHGYRPLRNFIAEKTVRYLLLRGYFSHPNRTNDTDCIISTLILHNDLLDPSSVHDIVEYLCSKDCEKLMDNIDGSDISLHNLNHLIPFDINYNFYRYTSRTAFIQPCPYI